MSLQERIAVNKLVDVLAIVCDSETIAAMMDATLSAEGDERLNDEQVPFAEALFDQLTEIRPDCIELAQKR